MSLVACLLCAVGAKAATSGEILQLLNAQRAANGLPADVRERPEWSSACRAHNDYQLLYGLTHDEDPAVPGYSAAGTFVGANGLVANEATWGPESPWFDAPIHLHQLLTPMLSETGADDHGGYQCVVTIAGWNRTLPGDATLWTYPGDGRSGVKASEVASEEPFVPGDAVGLPRGTRTGPHLLVFGNDTTKITAASLTGPTGAVEVRWVDNTTKDVGDYLTPGGIVIPTKPLRNNAGYTASVTATIAGEKITKTWRFGTGTAAAPKPPQQSADSQRRSAASGRECQVMRLSAKRARALAKRQARVSRQRKLLARARLLEKKIRQLC